MMKTVFVYALMVLMSSYGTFVYAQSTSSGHDHGQHQAAVSEGKGPGASGTGSHHERHDMGPEKGQPLTPEQRDEFRELRRKFIRENAQLIGAMLAKRLEFQSLWTDPKSDPKTIVEKGKELGALQAQMHEKVLQAKVEARSILTPEQLTRFNPRWLFGRQMMRYHREMMGGGGMGGERRGMMRHRMMGHGGMQGHGMMGGGQMQGHGQGQGQGHGGMMQGHGMGGGRMSGGGGMQGGMMQQGMGMGCCGGGSQK